MTPVEIVVLVVGMAALVIAGIGIGILWERHRRDDLIEEAADAAVDELVARQIADDRRAIASMPPGVEVSDVLELADRHGIGVREAALILFRAQARARLDANLRRHHPASKRKHR